MLRYDSIQDSLHSLGENLVIEGLADTYSSLSAKSGFRPEGSKQLDEFYREIPRAVEHIAAVCKQEIDLFGFQIPGS